MTIDLNIKTRTIKILEENTKDLEIGKDFLIRIQKVLTTKGNIDKLNVTKIKMFNSLKRHHKEFVNGKPVAEGQGEFFFYNTFIRKGINKGTSKEFSQLR